ncbi:MAG: DNA-binding transcriptional regulator Cro [Pseudomonadota bacterium]|jgi:hypothetical protein
MSERLNPAWRVIQLLGGVRATARAAEINPSAVSRWAMPREKKGTSGAIPQRHWSRLLGYAQRIKVKLTLNDLSGL